MPVYLRFKTLKSKKKSYYLDIYHNGQRYYEFLKPHVTPSATNKLELRKKFQTIARLKAEELDGLEYGYIPKHKKKVDFIGYYEDFLENYTGKDIRIVRYSLEKFKIFYPKKKLPSSLLTTKVCKGFAEFLTSEESGLKGETPYNYFTKFKKVVNEATKDGILKNNPITSSKERIAVTRKKGQLKKNILLEDELQLLAKTECGNKEVKRSFLFACFTGLGMAEIRKLTWSKISKGKIKLNREKTDTQVWNDLPEVAIKLLGVSGEQNEFIFNVPSDVSVGKTLKRWVKKSGIEKNISFYCGRHTFATMLLIKGANLKTVADCLGHTTTKETIKYLHYVNELKSEAINRLPSLEL